MRFLLALMLLTAPGVACAQRVELPIREVDLTDGARRYVVTLRIDGTAVDVGIDTGSTGLRVLPRALGAESRAATGRHVDYGYGAGTRFEGTAIQVPVAFGSRQGSVTVMRIDRVGCTAAKRDCPAGRADPARYGIQGDGLDGEGFGAILGIRLKRDSVDNPFLQLGAKRWIVELPRPGRSSADTSDGRIILDPSDVEVAAYHGIDVDEDGTTPGCIVGPAAIGKLCGRTFFDSGAPGLRILGADRFVPWPNGTPATLVIGDGDSAASMAVEIGRRDQATGMFFAPTPGLPDRRLSFGLAPYFHWSVLYDAGAGRIALKQR